MGFGPMDQFYTFAKIPEGPWEVAQPVHMCFVDQDKAYERLPQGVLWGCSGLLLRAIRSLYCRSQSSVHVAGSKSNPFPVRFSLRQGCLLSPVLFIIFIDRISKHSQAVEGVCGLQIDKLGPLRPNLRLK